MTFHHPKKFKQLLIFIYKDLIKEKNPRNLHNIKWKKSRTIKLRFSQFLIFNNLTINIAFKSIIIDREIALNKYPKKIRYSNYK